FVPAPLTSFEVNGVGASTSVEGSCADTPAPQASTTKSTEVMTNAWRTARPPRPHEFVIADILFLSFPIVVALNRAPVAQAFRPAANCRRRRAARRPSPRNEPVAPRRAGRWNARSRRAGGRLRPG